MNLQAKKQQKLPAASRNQEKDVEQILLNRFQKEPTLPKPWFLDF
jgi:hypothetical protein